MKEILIPGSKYSANRALLLAALADGQSIIKNVPNNRDIQAVLCILDTVGVEYAVNTCPTARTIDLRITGKNITEWSDCCSVNVSNNGTLARFITAILSLSGGTYTIELGEQMSLRPMDDLIQALRVMGARVSRTCPNQITCLPPIKSHQSRFVMSGAVSSQYLSGILIALAAKQKRATICVQDLLVSALHVKLTCDWLSEFGIAIEMSDQRQYSLQAERQIQPMNTTLSPDPTAASYFMAKAMIEKKPMCFCDWPKNHTTDCGFVEILRQMGATFDDSDTGLVIQPPEIIKGGTFDMTTLPDEVPTLAAIAPLADTEVVILGVAHLIHKESNRLTALERVLKQIGVQVVCSSDRFVIQPGFKKSNSSDPLIVNTYDDHRVAMAAAVIQLYYSTITMDDKAAVMKSQPSFWQMWHER